MTWESSSPSRRNVLAAGAIAAVSLPVLNSTFEMPALAADGDAPATAPGWIPTVKANDLIDGAYETRFKKLRFVLSRDGKNVYALNTKCTHKGCTVKPDVQHAEVLTCPCHGARFDISGSVVHGPAQNSLARFPIRLSDKGVVEVDTSRKVTEDDQDGVLTLTDAGAGK
jgi:nitrite reductase/ring-hydroxylating ferredoxin subunit